jgi:hypothetical protein
MQNNLTGKYILEGHKPVPCDDLIKWAEWIENAHRTGEIIVKSDMVKGAHVSTVFLGLDHGFRWFQQARRPLLFETIIFGGPMAMYQNRYSTWVGAEHGHNQAVKKCIQTLTKEARRKLLNAFSKESLTVTCSGELFKKRSPKSRVNTYVKIISIF